MHHEHENGSGVGIDSNVHGRATEAAYAHYQVQRCDRAESHHTVIVVERRVYEGARRRVAAFNLKHPLSAHSTALATEATVRHLKSERRRLHGVQKLIVAIKQAV